MKVLARSVLLFSFATTVAASAADLAVKVPPPAPWSWTGLYVGFHVGGGSGASNFSDPFGPSIFGDKVRTPGFLGGGQIGYNWELPSTRWVLGAEADISGLDSDGTSTCFAFSGDFVSANCRVRPRATGTFTGRFGYAAGPSGRTLLYAKGGAAWLHDSIDITTNNLFNSGVAISTASGPTRWGWTAGAGIEQALTPAWSLKLEYDYLHFGGMNVATPASETVTPGGITTIIPGNVSSASQDLHLVKLGVNYRWGVAPKAGWDSAVSTALPVKAPPRVAWASGWDIEIGPRYWYNLNRFQWDNAGAVGGLVQSRLTYDDRKTHASEVFGRVDSPWGIFAKGFVGRGWTGGGHMNDEDWGIQDPGAPAISYTNTRHDKVDGSIRYATADLGYAWLKDARYRVGSFIGYNYFNEKMNAFGCVQIASPANPGAPCAPGNPGFQPVPTTGSAVITERATWQSLRLGVVGDYMLTDRLKLTAEAAYLPYVKFDGEDNHFKGNSGILDTVFPQAGHGAGVQLEAMLSYALTDRFSVGLGGRYWAMWTTQAQYCAFAAGTAPCMPSAPIKAATEQAGLLVQASYRFSVPSAVGRPHL
ncbi:outer membrane beta-barrel protein [Bradyrhizobium lablabi]|uniref:outer membrane beta-barrel protein n=1 Tax=Bradyrhizobium lablabi TaxID=722472 RepID=UPI0032DF8699